MRGAAPLWVKSDAGEIFLTGKWSNNWCAAWAGMWFKEDRAADDDDESPAALDELVGRGNC